MDMQTSSPAIFLNCRVVLELVDVSGKAEQRQFRLVRPSRPILKAVCWARIRRSGGSCWVTMPGRTSLIWLVT
jgi:hypothetical protein